MIKKLYPYVNNPGNQSDGVLKDVADLFGKSLRVSDAHSVVDRHFSHVEPSYNGDNLPNLIYYYHGTAARRTTFTLGMADTLDGKYFEVYTAPEDHKYTFWFNLDGGSVQPVVGNTHTYVQVDVSTGDSPAIVGLAIKLAIEAFYDDKFYSIWNDDSCEIEIITSQMGVNQESTSGTTGFPISQIEGAQDIVQKIELEYDGQDPYWQGSILIGYAFDVYAGRFVLRTATEATLSEINDKLNNDYGDSTGALRTASQIGNSTGAADFGVGLPTSQTLRTVANAVGVDPNNTVVLNKESGKVDNNSTTTPLVAGDTFIGDWVDASQYSCISWTVNADVDSAVNGMRLQFSHDAATIVRQSATNHTGAANGVFFSFPVHAKYFRIYYENGAVNQTRFIIDTQLHEEYNGLAAIPLDTPLNDKSSATTVKGIIAGKAVDGVYVNQRASGVSTLNSTTTPLGVFDIYTGTFEDVVGFSGIAVTVRSDVESATDGLIAEYSSDGVNVDHQDFFTLTANTGGQFTFGVLSKYFRIRYINGATPQTTFRLSCLYNLTDVKPSSIRIDDEITGQNDAELVKSVLTGENPNGLFVNVPTQGDEAANSHYTALAGNETFRGSWRRWASDYLTLISSISSDVSGTLYIDASDEVSPVDGSDANITYTNTSYFDPAEVPALRRNTPVQSLWVRHRYINGPAAQTFFNLSAIFTTADPGSVYLPAQEMPPLEALSAVTRGIVTIPNADGDGFQDLPVDSITGNPKTTISNIRDDVLLKPLGTASATQVVVGTVATRIDPSPVNNRRSTMISNDGSTSCALGFSNAITYDSGSMIMPAGSVRILPFNEDIEYWAIAQNTGGVQSTLTRSGATNSGTATNTVDALTSNNVYSNITATSQTCAIEGYTAGTANPLVSVKLGMEANKQSGQFETVTVTEVQSGATAGAGTVVSASLSGGLAQLYVAFISRNDAAGTVTQVIGGGNTFTASLQNVASGNRRLDVWYSYGSFSSGAVTASLSGSTNAHITVYRIANANGTTPIQTIASTSGTGTAVVGPAITGTNKGYSLLAVSHVALSGTAGAGYTEDADATNGGGGNIDSLATESKVLTVSGAETATYTLGSSVAWSAIGLTINPADAIDPRVTLSYELSGIPGVTSDVIVLSSSSDSSSTVNITGDRAWVVADIANVKVIATGAIISGAAANIDYLYLELVDTTGNTTRVSVMQGGEAVI